MRNPEPSPSVVIKAVECISLAYEGPPPVVVQSQLHMMRSAGAELYKSAVVTRNLATPPTRYSIRLGNRYYPHMKLTIELAPGRSKLAIPCRYARPPCLPSGEFPRNMLRSSA